MGITGTREKWDTFNILVTDWTNNFVFAYFLMNSVGVQTSSYHVLVSIPGNAVGPLALEIKGPCLLVLSMVVQSGRLVASSCWNVLVVIAVIAWSFLAPVSTYAVYCVDAGSLDTLCALGLKKKTIH